MKYSLKKRPRRLRRSHSVRKLVQETELNPKSFVFPLFITEGKSVKQAIKSLPGQFRCSIDETLKTLEEAKNLGISSFALFPHIEEKLKDARATESKNSGGLVPRALQSFKEKFPDICLITDVAMDPYSSEGHDGYVENGKILNDESLDILKEMALVQAKSGADFVAPSDMMDGRVGAIRDCLDEMSFEDVGIISYSAKYASSFYGPFREALDSAPKFGDKKTYQMDPANSKEAIKEALLDIEEGADVVMVKPALAYLDIIAKVKEVSEVPVAAYNVSGEYALLKQMAESGLIDHDKGMLEILGSIRRAGADIIFTYHALEAARLLRK